MYEAKLMGDQTLFNYFLPNAQEMGFETFNPILNLGGIFVGFILYLLQIIFIGVLKVVVNFLKGARER